MMRYSYSLGGGSVGMLIGVAVAATVLTSQVQPARAQTTATAISGNTEKWTVQTSTAKAHPGRPYFIEFRARSAASYGHMYVLYGRVNGADQIVSSRIAGLHPAGDKADCFNCSVFNWSIGHLVPVPSETGASDGDLEEKYVTARYRVWLTQAEFKKVDAYVRKLQADNPTWNALFNNCVGFGRNIAEFMGLKMPMALWPEPKDFVDGLRAENGMKHEQLPLRDAGGGGASASVSHEAPLPPQKPAAQPVSTTEAPKPAMQPASTTQAPKPAPAKKKPVASAPEAEPPTLASIFKREQRMTNNSGQ